MQLGKYGFIRERILRLRSNFEIKWDDKKKLLTISDRKGNYPGMTQCRNLRLVKVDKNAGIGVEESTGGKIVKYEGKQLKIRMK